MADDDEHDDIFGSNTNKKTPSLKNEIDEDNLFNEDENSQASISNENKPTLDSTTIPKASGDKKKVIYQDDEVYKITIIYYSIF